ncbi:MAG: hypothetical protein Q9159_007596 [Coniocarpon cinnabarinum]
MLDKIKVSKVQDVTLWRRGVRHDGTLHLTQHHIIFSHSPPPQSSQPASTLVKPRELWITYPMISFCTYRPAPAVSRQQPCIRLRCRDFTYTALNFATEKQAQDVFDTIRNLTCRLGRLEHLYAFTYQPQGPEKHINGWTVYNPMQEWRRQGIGAKSANKGWRISQINTTYQYSPTYPALLPVPTSISDNVLNYAGRYRSRSRIPVLTYLHPVNDCSITRSSQPLVGVRGNRSVQDEKLVAAVFSTSKHLENVEHSSSFEDSAPHTQTADSVNDPEGQLGTSERSLDRSDGEAGMRSSHPEHAEVEPAQRLYGAQQSNLIVDARPTVNAFAMQAVGMGSENMDHYPFATKAYLGIDNIHVMRDSLNKIVDALKDSDITPLRPNREPLAKSNWLKHISNMLDGASLIARQIGVHHSHVLIHCSDGWDRTSQLSALSQLCLDPYFRSLEGFIVLVEKDFLSFGHMFRYRSGFLGSEKWFDIENERTGGDSSSFGSSASRNSPGSSNAFESALRGAKGFFNKHAGSNFGSDSREDLAEADELAPYENLSPSRTGSPSTQKASSGDDPRKPTTKVKETSPVFHQFLDATYQLLSQHPDRFEFNERFLRRLLYHLYSCQYGTFLYDNEKQRVEGRVSERTRSVWNYFLARREMFVNQGYVAEIDDNVRGKERLIFPDLKRVKWWTELFGRTDEEMNTADHPTRSQAEVNIEKAASAFESNVTSEVIHDANDPSDTAPSDEAPAVHPVEHNARYDNGTLGGEGLRSSFPTVQDFPSTGLGTGSSGTSTPSRPSNNMTPLAAGLARVGLGAEAEADPEPTHGQGKGVAREIEVELQ